MRLNFLLLPVAFNTAALFNLRIDTFAEVNPADGILNSRNEAAGPRNRGNLQRAFLPDQLTSIRSALTENQAQFT